MTISPKIAAAHAAYVRETGMDLRLDMDRERQWYEWLKCGFTPDDLRLVVSHLRREIRAERRNPGCLKFHNLIGMPDFFEEDLAAARALARRPKDNPSRTDALRATGRSAESAGKPAKPAGEILASEAFKALLSVRDHPQP